MSARPAFVWKSDVVYCGGGKKLPRPIANGLIFVNVDGGLSIEPDDDYYSGELSPEEALELAKAIVAAHEAKVPT